MRVLNHSSESGCKRLVTSGGLSRLLASFLFVALSGTPLAVWATTYTVNSASDVVITASSQVDASTGIITGSGGTVTLRSAVIAANISGAGPHLINVPAGLGPYNLSQTNPDNPAGAHTGGLSDLQVGSDGSTITIQGTGGTAKIVQTVTSPVVDVITTGFKDAAYDPAIVNLTLSNLEITGGTYTGVFTGADDGVGHISRTTIQNCNLHDNSNTGAYGQGGAIFNEDGNLTISGSTFTNNSAPPTSVSNPLGQGGAIFYAIINSSGQGSTGSLSITGSTFTNNSTNTTEAGPAGGAIFISAATSSTNTFSISGCTFSGNFVGNNAGGGGAIAVASSTQVNITNCNFVSNLVLNGGGLGGAVLNWGVGSRLNISFSRFTGNSTVVGHGPAIYNELGTVTAIDNWWGRESGPGTDVVDASGTTTATTISPYLKLEANASPNPILVNGATTVTADLFSLSTGGTTSAANLANLPAYTPSAAIFVAPTLGVLTSAETEYVGGEATAIFTAGGVGGLGSVTALSDGASVPASITIDQPPAITNGPPPATGTVGVAYSTFNYTASGYPTPTFYVATGALPGGLSLSPNGILSGTPNASGTFSGTIAATNGVGDDSTQPFNIVISPAADLAVTATDGVTSATPGNNVSYTVVVTNHGPSTATGATIVDNFPAALTGVSFIAVTSGGATGFTTSGTGNINDTVTMPSGSTITYTISGTINPAATGSLSNTATATVASGTVDTNPANNSATDTDTLTVQTELAITNTDNVLTRIPGTIDTYTVVVGNSGPSAASGATISEVFPAALTGVTYHAVGSGGAAGFTASGVGNISDTVSMPAGGTITYTITGNIDPAATGTLVTTATVAAPSDINLANNSATDTDTLTPQVDLAATVTDGKTVALPGTPDTYTIVVSNSGPSSAVGSTITDTFPATFTNISYTAVGAGGANGFITSGTGNISATADLPPGSSITYTATGTISAAATGTLSNTSSVIAASGITDTNPGNNSATDTDTLNQIDHYVISSIPTNATAGAAFNFTVTAYDLNNQVFTAYTGTVHFTSTDAQAVLPADTTLTNGVGTFSATLKTSGSQRITATDTVTTAATGGASVNVAAAAANHYVVTAPANATAGTAFNLTVTAQDQYSNTVIAYAGTAHFTSTDGQAVLPADATLTNGTGTFSTTLKTAGIQSITSTDTTTPSITGLASTLVAPAAVNHFAIAAPSTATAGTALSFTATAKDNFNNTVTGYTGTVHFTSMDGQAVLPANATLTNGVGTFNATLKTSGNQTLTATDTVNAAVSGTSAAIAVGSATANHLAVTAPSTATAGIAFSLTVTAQDNFNNTATGYTGTVHFTSTDGQAVLPANATLTNGVGTFNATLKTAASQTITATDTVSSLITGTTLPIVVSPAAATHYAVSAPTPATAGTPFNLTVTAEDTFGNTATAYLGSAHFTSTDGQAVLPANSTLTNGAGTFSVTLKTAGSQTLTATDTVTPSITGTTTAITVNPAPVSQFVLSVPTCGTAGVSFNFTITAEDPYANVVPTYTGVVHFTSTDAAATLPADSTLTTGTGTFAATLNTTGNKTITGKDTVTPAITGTGLPISVIAIPTITPTATTVCPGSVGNQVSGPAGATSYLWSITNGSITSATNIQNITYTAGASGTVHLGLTVQNATLCSASNSTDITISPLAVPTITIGAGASGSYVAMGSTGDGASGPAGATTYAWTITNGKITSGATSQNVVYTAGSTGTLTLNLTITNSFGCSATNSASLTVVGAMDFWREQNFGSTSATGNAANDADPANDGITNLLKYALGLDPNVATTTANNIVVDTTTGFQRMTVTRNPAATDVTYTIQVSADMVNWSDAGTTVDIDTPTTLRAYDNTPIINTRQRFIRLIVTQP